ncbi:MAG TPA: spore coat protein CotH [Lachnospiraceae bacterium]|nr:CotH kinase family protein [Lachnospiraceae bacterium]HAV00415.1 spore coat protein CotH [Lachnospiraceae bacterium]
MIKIGKNDLIVIASVFICLLVAVGLYRWACSSEGGYDVNGINGQEEQYDMPVFNVPSGFYPEPFRLTISYPDPQAHIYCTFDGSIPTPESEPYEQYEEGLLLENRSVYSNYLSAITGVSSNEEYVPSVSIIKANTIRAIAVLPDGRASRVASGTYFIGIDRLGAFGTAPILSLYTDYDSLFSYEDGIYVLGKTYDEWLEKAAEYEEAEMGTEPSEVPKEASPEEEGVPEFDINVPVGNYSNRGSAWERHATVEYMPYGEDTGFVADLGMRIMGGSSRKSTQKSFRFKCREEYGRKNIQYDLIPGNMRSDKTGEVDTYKSFIMRNGGNDRNYGKIRDPFIQTMVSSHSFETQASRPAVLFINGEYWGCYSLCEDYSDHYIEYNYGIDKDNVIIIKSGRVEEGIADDMRVFSEMESFITDNDMSDTENYAMACEMLDMECFAGYCALNLYICNRDSFLLNDSNWSMWRVRTPDNRYMNGDGKWRMLCFDTDYSSGIYDDVETDADIMKEACDDDGSGSVGNRMLASLLYNEEFRNLFISELCDMRNIDFERTRVRDTIPLFRETYGLLVPYSTVRFGPEPVADPFDHVNRCIDKVEAWFLDRYDIFPEQIRKQFKLSEPVNVTVLQEDESKGAFTVDNSNILMTGEFKGRYFPQVPVSVTARPLKGESFDHWEVSNGTIVAGQGESVTLLPDRDCMIRPVYSGGE